MVSNTDPALIQVYRGPYLEAVHHGAIALVGGDRNPLLLGSTDDLFLPRSALKPIQAVAMLRAGLKVSAAELALAAASHDAEPFHLSAVVQILERAGLSARDLQTPAALPGDQESMLGWCKSGRGPEPLAHTCSGKHSAMLQVCRQAGWSTDDYREPEHPLQQSIAEVVQEFTGTCAPPVVDGCGAPAFGTTLTGLATAFGRLGAGSDPAADRVAEAYRKHPEYASGTHRDEFHLHRSVPGLICKFGAEGTFAFGLPDGTGVAIKIADGAHRATIPVVIAILDRLGLATEELRTYQPQPVLGHGQPVGLVRPTAELMQLLEERLGRI